MSELTNAINVPHAPKIIEVLKDWRSWCNHQPTFEKVLEGGLTNTSYLVESLGQHYVVRINATNSRALDLHRDTEARVLMLASDAGIGAELVYFDPYECYLVTKYIDGQHWQLSDSQTPEGIDRLAGLLKTIHALEPIEHHLQIETKADNYWRHIPDNSELAQSIQCLKSGVDDHILKANKNNNTPKLCHNDLILENLLLSRDQKFHALDWEYAAMGDPFFDLAVIVEGHELNESEALRLLESYLDNYPSSKDLSRLYSNRVIYRYLSVLWYAVKNISDSVQITDEHCRRQLRSLQLLLSASD